jgi:hypothetical protein
VTDVPGRIYGRVTRYDIDVIRDSQSLEPIPSVRTALDRPAGRVIATSDRVTRRSSVRNAEGCVAAGLKRVRSVVGWRDRVRTGT